MSKNINIAIIPVAGYGTRFYPITKVTPKEMLPIIDKPMIQYVVNEAVTAGINHIVFITSKRKKSIQAYFDRNIELEKWLKANGKDTALKSIESIISRKIKITYIEQNGAEGLGHAILSARHIIGDESFFTLLPDEILIEHKDTCLNQMLHQYNKLNSSIISVDTVLPQHVCDYGIIDLMPNDNSLKLRNIVEKPTIGHAPSQLAVIGRYLLTPDIFPILKTTQQGKDNEIQLTDALATLIQSTDVYAHLFNGQRFDCGSRLGLLKASLAFALHNKSLNEELIAFIKTLLKNKL